MARPELMRFEVYVRLRVDGMWLSMRVPDVHAVDGREALHIARSLYRGQPHVRGIRAVRT